MGQENKEEHGSEQESRARGRRAHEQRRRAARANPEKQPPKSKHDKRKEHEAHTLRTGGREKGSHGRKSTKKGRPRYK